VTITLGGKGLCNLVRKPYHPDSVKNAALPYSARKKVLTDSARQEALPDIARKEALPDSQEGSPP